MCVNESRVSTRHGDRGRGREGAREPKRMKLHVNHASLPGSLLRAPAWHKRVCLCACIRCAYLNALLSILKVFNLSVCRFVFPPHRRGSVARPAWRCETRRCAAARFFQEGRNPWPRMHPFARARVYVCARLCCRLIWLASAQPSLHCRLSAVFYFGFNDL